VTLTNDPNPTSPALRLITLGGAELVAPNHGASSLLFGPGKPVALLAYLSASPGLAARREHLIDLLWADMELDAGRHALRQTVWYVRQRAGDLLDASRDSIRLRAPIPNDRAELLAAVERQDCETVVALYLGDFLPNIALPGGGEFEQWADLERQRLRSAYLRCGEAVARGMLSAARHRDAVALARRLLERDPHSEHVWRLLIEAQLSANDLLGAASEADSLTRFLSIEGREPEPATRALVRRATAVPDAGAAAPSHAVATEMIGRAEEFKRLVASWDEARAGRFRHLHIVAASGIGKSRILADFAARLRAKGARVVSVRLRPGDRALPQSAAGDIAAALAALPGAAGISTGAARCIVALNPALSSTYSAEPDTALGDEGVRRRTVALHELIAAVADDAPVCIIVDDLHWMDDVSRRMLTSVLQRLETQRVLVVTSSRPRYPGITAPGTEEITLHPLSAAQVGALIAALGSLPDADWALRFPELLHASTGGSPLLTLETLQLLIERELLRLFNSWSTPDPRALEEALGAGKALSARIGNLQEGEREVLLDLAAAGVPLDDDALARSGRASRSETDRALAALEQRGLAMRLSEGWVPAHDAIGEAAIASASPDTLRATHLRLGQGWLEKPEADSLRRAAAHFTSAEAGERAREAFVRWVRVMRRQGDGRSLRVLAEDFVPAGGTLHARDLVTSVPLSLRIPRRVTYTGAALAAVVLAGAGLTSLRPDQPQPPDAVLTVMVPNERGAYRLELKSAEFAGDRPLELHGLSRVSPPPARATLGLLSPDGRSWVLDRVFPDSGGQDIALVDTRTGALRRLTHSRGDDASPAWSPDGRYVTYSASGVHPKHRSKIMVRDVETDSARQLTFGDDTDQWATWHPSGTFIAFLRRYWTDRPDDVCFVTVSGSLMHCVTLDDTYNSNTIGWYDAQRIIVRGQSDIGRGGRLLVVNVATREVTRLTDMSSETAIMSANGQWLACRCKPPGALEQPWRWHVFPVARPDLARRLMYSVVDERPLEVFWTSTHDASLMVTSVAVEAPEILYSNAPAQLRAVGVAVSGDRSAHLPTRWESLDRDVADVDPVTGLLTPRRAGTARVRVSLGGWRNAETIVAIMEPVATSLLRESWTGDPTTYFVHGGDPRPVRVELPGVGPALAINGDNSYTSGIYSRQAVSASRGLGADLLISARIRESTWQNLSVNLNAFANDSALAQWDHTHGGFPIAPMGNAAECYFMMPLAEGPRALRGYALQTSDTIATRPLGEALRSGRPFRLRVQLFPDGSCGWAIDGRPVGWLPGRRIGSERYRLIVHGYSAGTVIATGPVEMWTGVKPDIDWRSVRGSQ